MLEDAIQTYIYSKKYLKNNKTTNYQIDISVKIALLHDLYTIPWQNNHHNKPAKFFNKHGFRHPIESVINAVSWYPELFKKQSDAKKIIDGIIHHMYPLPVSSLISLEENHLELNNFDKIKPISPLIKNMIIESSNRKKIKSISLSKSIYKEGRIMAKADKYISIKQMENIPAATSLITGRNKKIKNNKNRIK